MAGLDPPILFWTWWVMSISSVFVYLAKRLDVSGHFALGPKGSEAFEQNLQTSLMSAIRLESNVSIISTAILVTLESCYHMISCW